MRTTVRFFAFGATLVASPALAQIGVNVGGQTGVNVGVGAQTVPNVGVGVGAQTNTNVGVGVNASGVANTGAGLQAATVADLRSGAVIRDRHGGRVGTVQSVSGNVALVARGGNTLRVPVSALFRSSTGLVTNLSKAQLDAMGRADAEANVRR